MNKDKIDELYKIHDAVKIHPFRISFDKKYLSSYGKIFSELCHKLYEYLKEDNDINYQGAYIAFHDWMSAVCACQHCSRDYDNHNEYMNHYLVYMDKVLGEIHYYLDNGKFFSVSTYISKGSTLYRRGLIKEKDLIIERRLSKNNKWVNCMSKETLKYYADLLNNYDCESDYYKIIAETFENLYQNYENNWE